MQLPLSGKKGAWGRGRLAASQPVNSLINFLLPLFNVSQEEHVL